MWKSWLVCFGALLVVGCAPARPLTGTATLEPDARQQLYTVEYGDRKAPRNLCAVDTTPLFVTVPGLEPDSLQVGYEATDVPKDDRRRCRRDRNLEHHAWLAFDLSDVSPPPGRLSDATLSGTAVLDPANSNCADRGADPFEGFLAGINVAPQIRVEPRSDDIALEAPPTTVDGESVPFRSRELFLADGDTSGRIGSPPLFVFTIAESQLGYLERRLRTRIDSDKPAVFTFIGADNPDITRDTVCLEQLQDIRLNLIFRAS